MKRREPLDPPRLGMWSADGAEYFPTPAEAAAQLRHAEREGRDRPRSISEIPEVRALLMRVIERQYSPAQLRRLARRWHRDLDALVRQRRAQRARARRRRR